MATYLENSVPDLSSLISSVSSFAQENGWTQNARKSILYDGTNSLDAAFLTIPGGGMCVAVARLVVADPYYASLLYLYAMGAYDGSATDIRYMPTLATRSNGFTNVSQLNTWPITRYYFFASGVSLHFIVESAPEIFHHFGFGILDRCAAYSGGQYVFGHYVSTSGNQSYPLQQTCSGPGHIFLRSDIEGTSNNWQSSNQNNNIGLARCYGKTYNSSLEDVVELTPNDFNGQVILYPIAIYSQSSGQVETIGYGTDYARHIAGFIPSTRFCSIASAVPRQEIVLGPDTWKVFPLMQKNGLGIYATGIEGLAIKKVV